MLKVLREKDIDSIMKLWKDESLKINSFLKNEFILNKYTNVRDKFIENKLSTTIYTEDDTIEGFVSVDKNNEIWSIAVKNSIQREGIGTILIKDCQKKYSKLITTVYKKNKVALTFFLKNNFIKIKEIVEKETNEVKYILEWNNTEKSKINLLYFDEDIENELIEEQKEINFRCINLRQFLKAEGIENINKINHIENIKIYIKLRRKLEEIIFNEKLILYINYNNYYNFMDELIKEIVNIKKIRLKIVVCEPFAIEGSKKNNIIKNIEESYKEFEIYKFDDNLDIPKNANLNQILKKRNEILIQKIPQIAQNM